MGIFCEINLFQPTDGIYQPGKVVSGVIKYAIDEPMEFQKITTSLKGIGCIVLIVSKGPNQESLFKTTEVYADINTIIQDNNVNLPIGSYAIQFSCILPQDLPSTMSCCKYGGGCKVKCYIRYYLSIKFERSGFFVFNKQFRKEITVKCAVVAKLLREPVIYGERMKLMHFFSSKESIVIIKATIPNSVLPFGGKIIVHYEVENKSQVLVKSVISKLVEVYVFMAEGYRDVIYEEDVPGTETKRMSINCNYTQKASFEKKIPSNVYNIEKSTVVLRHYLVKIIAQLPIPHKNVILNIPVQIGVLDENREDDGLARVNAVGYNDAPPSYWEAMREYDDVEHDDKKP